jgi:hypothetical protein
MCQPSALAHPNFGLEQNGTMTTLDDVGMGAAWGGVNILINFHTESQFLTRMPNPKANYLAIISSHHPRTS